ncbi:unnamed protein product [Agarophyton chilense]
MSTFVIRAPRVLPASLERAHAIVVMLERLQILPALLHVKDALQAPSLPPFALNRRRCASCVQRALSVFRGNQTADAVFLVNSLTSQALAFARDVQLEQSVLPLAPSRLMFASLAQKAPSVSRVLPNAAAVMLDSMLMYQDQRRASCVLQEHLDLLSVQYLRLHAGSVQKEPPVARVRQNAMSVIREHTQTNLDHLLAEHVRLAPGALLPAHNLPELADPAPWEHSVPRVL